jgi:hypothetical protein
MGCASSTLRGTVTTEHTSKLKLARNGDKLTNQQAQPFVEPEMDRSGCRPPAHHFRTTQSARLRRARVAWRALDGGGGGGECVPRGTVGQHATCGQHTLRQHATCSWQHADNIHGDNMQRTPCNMRTTYPETTCSTQLAGGECVTTGNYQFAWSRNRHAPARAMHSIALYCSQYCILRLWILPLDVPAVLACMSQPCRPCQGMGHTGAAQ